KVLGCNAPTEITMQIDFPFVGTVWRTDRAEAEGPSTTRVDTAISWKTSGIKAPVLDFMAARMLRKYGALYDKRVAELIQENEPAEQTRDHSSDQRGAAIGKAHPLCEPGQAAETRGDEQRAEHERQSRALHDRLQGRADQTAHRARRAKSEQHLAIDVRPHDEEPGKGPGEVGKRHQRDREPHVELRCQDRRENAPDAEAGDRGDRAGDHCGEGRHDRERVHALYPPPRMRTPRGTDLLHDP